MSDVRDVAESAPVMKHGATGWKRGLAGKVWHGFWGVIERYAYRGHEYTVQVPYGKRILTPWFATPPESEFGRMLASARASGRFIMDAERAYMLNACCRSCLRLEGDVAECGVGAGGTAHLLAQLMAAHGGEHQLHLLDTFQGTPAAAISERDPYLPGDHLGSLDEVTQRLRGFPFVHFHEGMIPETFSEIARVDAYSFVHVNVGLYSSTLECCKWFWPRLSPGGIMLVAEYGYYTFRRASRAALDEFLASVGESPIVLPTGQAVAIKR